MRLGINIPDDLLKRLEPLKTVTNVSQICRDAIKTHIEAYERAMARSNKDEINVIAKRLGNLLVPSEVDWELLGIEDAKMWVQIAKLEDFEYLFHRLEVLKRQNRSPYEVPIPRVEGVKSFEERFPEHHGWFSRRIEADETCNPYIEDKLIYQRGKILYILAVWEKARKIANERMKCEASARDKARTAARNEMEIPNHLVTIENPKNSQ